MQRYFQQHLLPEFFAGDFSGSDEKLLLLSGMVSPVSAEHIRQRLADLADEFDRLMAQDAVLPTTKRQGVSLVLGERPWSLSLFSPLRRTSAGVSG